MSELVFHIKRQPHRMRPIEPSLDEQAAEAWDQLARSASYLDNRTAVMSDSFREAFNRDAITVERVLGLRRGLDSHPYYNADMQSINLPVRNVIATLDALYAERAGVPVPPRTLRNPSPRTLLEGVGMVAGGLRQIMRGVSELARCIKWKDVFLTMAILAACAVIAVAMTALLVAMGVEPGQHGLWRALRR